MNLARLLNRIAASRMAKLGHEKAHSRIIERTREMRRQMGLPDDPRLA